MCNYENEKLSPLKERQLLEKVKSEINKFWDSYKLSQMCSCDTEVQGNGADKILLYLIRKGIINVGD